MTIHNSITLERVLAAVERDDTTGFCVGCGQEDTGFEPDARECRCQNCGESMVYGAEEILLVIL